MNLYYRIKHAIQDFRYDFRRRCQRFKHGYAYSDVWDIYCWFMRTIKPMLIQLRDHGIGISNELYVDGENERVKWEEILTEMIECLDMMDEGKVRESLGFGDAGSYKYMSCKDYASINNIMDQNKDRFFELFSKYFFSLWD